MDKYRITLEGAIHLIELKLPDTLDFSEFDSLNEGLLEVVSAAAAGTWVMDLTGSHYMGSAVLGLMVNIRQRIKKARGKLILCGMSDELKAIFHACSLERLFTISRTRAEAVKAAGK